MKPQVCASGPHRQSSSGSDGPVRLGNGLRGIQELAAGGRSTVEADGHGFRTVVELGAG